MRKLFTLTLALLASFSLWAADDIYYVAMVQNVAEDGTLSGTSGTLKVVKYTASTGKYAVTDAVSWSLSSPSVGCKGSSVSKCSDIADYSKWQQGSGSQKAKGPQFSGTTTLSLGSLTATKITFIGYRNNSGSGGTLQVGAGDAKTTVKRPSSAFGSDCVIEYAGSFTGDVSVIASDVHCGVFVITVPATPATKHHVTYKLNGGSGTTPIQADVAEGAKFTLHNGTTGITAPTNKDFDGWHDGTTKYAGGAEYTMGTSDVELTAQWKDHVANYTVIYKDGTTELGGETVEVGQHPTGSEIATPTKEFYTFAGWSPALSSVSGNDGDEVEVNATWTGNYAYGTYSFNALTVGSTITKTITDQEVTYADAFRVDNFYFDAGIKIQGETGSAAEGEALDNFIGWKLKTSDKKIRFLVENNCQVKVAIGEKTAIKVTYTPLTGSETTVDQVKDNETPYLVKAGSLVTIKTTSGNTTTLKRLIITNVYNVTYTDTKGDANGSANNVPEVTLPSPTETTVGDYNFTGWIADQAVTVGGVAKAAGTLLSAGVVCELTDNTTFTAQWQLIADFDVKFFQGYGDPDVQIGETQSISTGNNAVAPADPTREGYIFRGWSYDATEANIVDVATYAIAEATNFTAIWSLAYTITHSAAENGTYTIKVGDAEPVDANTAAYAGQTITLAASPSSGYQFSSWTVMNGATPVEVSNNQFTMPAANVTVSATFEVKPSVNDLETIADDWTFTPSETIAAGTLAEDNKLFASGANDCDYTSNGMRIKENRALAFKLNSGAKVKITFKTDGERAMKLGTAMTGDASSVYGSSNISPVVFNVTADGVVYLTTTSDLRFSKMEITYPHTVTYDLNGGTGTTPIQDASYVGTEITIASSTAFEKVGYNFTGWLCNIDSQVKAANAPYTMTAANTTFTAQWEAINYAVTLAAGTNATTAGVANIDYDAAALVITTAPKGTGTLLGFYTATTASDETKVANADGTLVNDNVTGYVTDGKWSCTSAATLYAVYDGVPTALDNTADEIKAVKFIENGQLFIRRGEKVYTITGEEVK